MTEVEQILTWLGNLEAHFRDKSAKHNSKRREYTHHANACKWAADGIRNGEHKREWTAP